MPQRPATPCPTPRCPTLGTTTLCPLDLGDHCPRDPAARARLNDRARPTARQRGYTTIWQRTRARYLATHPWCTHPTCTQPATDVHHLDGLGPLGPRGHDKTNLQALCHPHHSQVTDREQGGGWQRRQG